MSKYVHLNAERLSEIRHRAEFLVQQEDLQPHELSAYEMRSQLQELRTHQLELEMQNDELCAIQQELAESKSQLSDLYNFAPVGYATLTAQGKIIESNITLANMVGTTVPSIVESLFSTFISEEDQDIFYLCRNAVIKTGFRQTCQLRMKNQDNIPTWVEIVLASVDPAKTEQQRLRAIISDISLRKHAEETDKKLERQILHRQKLESLGLLAGGDCP